MNLVLEAQLTAEDYIAAQRLHVGWRNFIRLSLLMFVLIVAVTLAITELGPHRFWLGPTVWLIWLLIFSGTYPQAVAKRARKIFAQQQNLHLRYTMTITDEKLVMSAPGRGEWIVPWSEIRKWNANDTIVLAYPSDALFRMFPRRWFSTDATFAEFKQLLARAVGPMGKPRAA